MEKTSRPSKKQRELLSFIDGFIKGYGYGPSYREIMRALDYKSVSTVAVHVDGLIAHGYLRKTDNSARSLEVLSIENLSNGGPSHIEWLRREIKKRQAVEDKQAEHEVKILNEALDILNPSGE